MVSPSRYSTGARAPLAPVDRAAIVILPDPDSPVNQRTAPRVSALRALPWLKIAP